MRLALSIGLALLVVDPMACMPYREQFRFGLSDIEAAIDGTWYATWTRDGERHTMPFRLRVAAPPEQTSARGWIRSASACGVRTLVRSAHACTTATFVSLELVPLDSMSGPFGAMLYIGGYEFRGAVLNLTLGAPDADVSAAISATGDVETLVAPMGLSVPPVSSATQLVALWHVDDPY